MKTNKSLLILSTLGLITLTTPAFALSYGGGSNAMNEKIAAEAGVTSSGASITISQWDGGGSNALSAINPSVLKKSVAADKVAAWDGGGSNSMNQSATVASFPARQETTSASGTASKVRTVVWDGGGSNAMGQDVAQLACQSVQGNFQNLDANASGSDAMSGPSNLIACAGSVAGTFLPQQMN